MPASRHGFSLVLVLLVASLLTVVGYALATLATFNLTLSGEQLRRQQANATARAALADVMAELDAETQGSSTVDLTTAPSGGQLQAWLAAGNLFRDRADRFPGAVTITFDTSQPYYSVDNLGGAGPAAGYADRNKSTLSIPAYSLDLIINVAEGSVTHHYEAVVGKVWSYALANEHEPVFVRDGGQVVGSVYAGGRVVTFEKSLLPDITINDGGSVTGNATDPDGSDGVRLMGDAFLGGAIHTLRIPPAHFPLARLSTAEPTSGVFDTDTMANARVIQTPVQVGAGDLDSIYTNLTWVFRDSEGQVYNPGVNPPMNWQVAMFTRVNIGGQMVQIDIPIRHHASGDNPYAHFLTGTLTLQDGNYAYVGDLANHFLLENVHGENQRRAEAAGQAEIVGTPQSDGSIDPSGLKLINATLWVQGNLDVRNLTGNNATVIVTGTLRLEGGTLNAGDKGMVILAGNVILAAAGKYNGVVASQGLLCLDSVPGRPLHINGGVIGSGTDWGVRVPTVVRNATIVTWNPAYMRALNTFGSSRCGLFREIP